MAVAWIHLFTFLACQRASRPAALSVTCRHLVLWIVELAAVIVTMRRVAGLGWFWSSPAINVIARLWVTFLILSFNVATLNALTGWESLWFKASWGTLSTFLFAALAWLFTPKFLIPAVQMYFTALLMARFPEWNNLIYGVSWWAGPDGHGSGCARRERVGKTRGVHRKDEHRRAVSVAIAKSSARRSRRGVGWRARWERTCREALSPARSVGKGWRSHVGQLA